MRKQGHFFFVAPEYSTCSTNVVIVEKDITKSIDDLVKEQVAECLKGHIPRELQEEVADSKRELEELNLALYNSYVFHPISSPFFLGGCIVAPIYHFSFL